MINKDKHIGLKASDADIAMIEEGARLDGRTKSGFILNACRKEWKRLKEIEATERNFTK